MSLVGKIRKKNMPLNFDYNYPQAAREAGFKLRLYKDGPLDWRVLGSVEVERILKDQNLEQIDDVVGHLSEVPLGSILETNILDSGIAKYFLLSQFSVQYLLFCRTFLAETVNDLRESHGSAQMEVATLKRSLSEANNEILQLHKKITHMEAIHEVIYPCHLCTKNFISNDALNLHISRKHNAKVERKLETPCLIAKEREHDLNLINTIKLELEIKQLKERLNNAEREIKEKSLSNSKRSTPQPNGKGTEELKSKQSIGIQSNLTELKEKDDNNENAIEHKDQILILQEKLNDFETWKQTQKEENSEFFRDIHKKLSELTEAFEGCKHQKEKAQDEIEQEIHNIHSTAPSIEYLEDFLFRKVEDISKQSSDKLEKMVLKLEQNYKEKLKELQNDFKKIAAINIENSNQNEQLQKKSTADVREIKRCEDGEERERDIIFVAEETKTKESISSNSNRTFVQTAPTMLKISFGDSDNDEDSSTNISESLEEENPGIDSTSCKKSTQPDKTFVVGREQSCHSRTELVSKTIKIKPKTIIREDVKKLANTRLKALGLDAKTKSLSQTSMKRLTSELNEKRNRMTQKYPNFHATRDKIRRFVDKLCSSKMPAGAQILLEQTRPKKPREDNQEKLKDADNDETDDDGASPVQASTPVNETSTLAHDEFKERLERILASPIKKPDNYKPHIIKAVVHQEDNRPVPFPRKKVMFEHANVSTEYTENGGDPEVPITKRKSSHRLLSDDNLRSLL
ncbi:zinc finger protein DZIP1L [Glossina fuscipes]|uniref:Zinc finger protein DZIP1L n=1 Tax=Glossina fuscipes TaxID=7396 RepID=A0A9C6DUQ0_9MUSC|nr:zinc finger protein DZIP1L [Glossina fuscipes]KAI9580265.1 hypothetical protein GQX74_000258 [Glossina fuscipes]